MEETRLRCENERLRAGCASLREAMAEVQWCVNGTCPRCHRSQYLGHAPWCVIGEAMKFTSCRKRIMA